jgi:hypothetical protein
VQFSNCTTTGQAQAAALEVFMEWLLTGRGLRRDRS